MTTIDRHGAMPEWAQDLIGQGILVTDTDLTIRYWNRWLEAHSGYAAEDVVGRNLLEVYPDLLTRHLDAHYRQAQAGQVSVLAQRLHHYLLPIPLHAEQSAFAQMQQSARVGPLVEGGQIVGTITVIDDVTERVAREEELKRLLMQERAAHAEAEVARREAAFLAEERARLLASEHAARLGAEAAGERVARLHAITVALSEALTPAQVVEVIVRQGIAALNAQAGLVALLANDGATLELVSALGYPPAILDVWRRIPIDTPVPLADAVRTKQAVILELPAERDARYPLLSAIQSGTKSGSLAALPLLSEGRAIGVLGLSFADFGSFSDDDRAFALTLAHQCAQAIERARLYEAERKALAIAQEALRMRDVFFSIASHELKTPLTSLLGNAQLLQRRAAREGILPQREQRAITVIAEQAARLNKMIIALLDISRIEMGHLSIVRERLDLGDLIGRVVAETQPSLSQHTIAWSKPDEPLIVSGDDLRLEQVVQNLLQNAIKYSPAGGEISIRVARQGNLAQLSITDQGIGIPEQALPRLFQRFYRAENADARYISGLGIGLYVVKEIVALHAGTVAVESEEGAGSTFTIRLPVWEDAGSK